MTTKGFPLIVSARVKQAASTLSTWLSQHSNHRTGADLDIVRKYLIDIGQMPIAEISADPLVVVYGPAVEFTVKLSDYILMTLTLDDTNLEASWARGDLDEHIEEDKAWRFLTSPLVHYSKMLRKALHKAINRHLLDHYKFDIETSALPDLEPFRIIYQQVQETIPYGVVLRFQDAYQKASPWGDHWCYNANFRFDDFRKAALFAVVRPSVTKAIMDERDQDTQKIVTVDLAQLDMRVDPVQSGYWGCRVKWEPPADSLKMMMLRCKPSADWNIAMEIASQILHQKKTKRIKVNKMF